MNVLVLNAGSSTLKFQLVRTDPERNLLLLNGTLPGSRGSLILVKKA